MKSLRVTSSVSLAGGSTNEDAFGYAGDLAWVIDGASGVASRRYTTAPSDACWYATTLSQTLARMVATKLPLRELLARAIAKMTEAFLSHVKVMPPVAEQPSACVTLVRFGDVGLEYAIIGDCDLLTRDAQNQVHHLRDTRVEPFERPLAHAVQSLARSGVTDPTVIRQSILPQLLDLRRVMNQPQGFDVARFEPDVAARAIAGTLPDVAAPVVLASDGLCRLFDVFEVMTPATFYDQVVSGELEPLAAKLRALEHADAHSLRYARVKAHDDATCIVLERA
jgi:hypothetical protein